MKKFLTNSLLMATLCLFLHPSTTSAQAEDNAPKLKETKVWTVEYIRTKPGKDQEYQEYLAENYVKMMDAAKEKGIISDFILLDSRPGNEQDWDMMILIAVEKYADFDNIGDKFDQLRKEMLGDKEKEVMEENKRRFALRDIQGGKMARQLVLDE